MCVPIARLFFSIIFLHTGLTVLKHHTYYQSKKNIIETLTEKFQILDDYVLTPFFFFEEPNLLVEEYKEEIIKFIGLFLIILGICNVFDIPEATSILTTLLVI